MFSTRRALRLAFSGTLVDLGWITVSPHTELGKRRAFYIENFEKQLQHKGNYLGYS